MVDRKHVMSSAEIWVPEDYLNNIKSWLPTSQKTTCRTYKVYLFTVFLGKQFRLILKLKTKFLNKFL